MRRIRAYRKAAAAPLVAAVIAAAPANAAVTVGQLPDTAPLPSCSGAGSGFDYLQTSVTGGTLYSARQAGTITSWSTLSSGAGATYRFKVFRRTSDPDAFEVVGRDVAHTLSSGLNTFPTSLQVKSGDLIGLHEQGSGNNSCTFTIVGDGALQAQGDLAAGQSDQFAPVADVRLNLSAVLNPSNAFTITGITRHRRSGTATMTVDLSNPGLLTIGGKGLRKKHVSTALARRVTINIATAGKLKARLSRRGKLNVSVAVIFFPTGGDPSSQTVALKLVQRGASRSI
jgi:hypothetical protein